jgi:hypothetical protein
MKDKSNNNKPWLDKEESLAIEADCAEPLIHSHLTDALPDDHKQAHQSVYCIECNTLCHASNNECMTTWIEYKGHCYCGQCFASILINNDGCLEDDDFYKGGRTGECL